MPITIEYLYDFPEFKPTIGEWYKEFWGTHYPDRTLEDWKGRLLMNKGDSTFTLIAIDNDSETQRPVATATIRKNGMGDYEPDSLWLSGVFVVESERKKGIATALIEKSLEISTELNVEKIMLFTRSDGNLYQNIGWTLEKETIYQNSNVKIMSKNLEYAPSFSMR